MSFVWARVHGNSLRAKPFAVNGYLDYIWIVTSTRIAQGGDLVNVYGEASHGAKRCIFIFPNTLTINQSVFMSIKVELILEQIYLNDFTYEP